MSNLATLATRLRNYLLAHWRGELPLAVSILGNGLSVWIAFTVAIRLLEPRFPYLSGDHWAVARAILTALSYPVAIWQLVGISRAGLRYQSSTGDIRGGTLVQVLVIFASFVIFISVASHIV